MWHYTFGVCYHELDAESVSVVIKLTRHSVVGWLLLTGFCASLGLTTLACVLGSCCSASSSRSRISRRTSANNRRTSISSSAADGDTTRKLHRRTMSRFYWLLTWPFVSIDRLLSSLRQQTFIDRNPYRHIANNDTVIVVGDRAVK